MPHKSELTADACMEWARDACRAATADGADQAEAFIQSERIITVTVENNQLRSSEEKEDPGFCLRAIKKGATGYARGMGVDADTVRASGAQAAAMAAAAEPDPRFDTLPGPAPIPAVAGLFDEAVAALSSADVIPWAAQCMDAARQAHPHVALKMDITIVSGWTAIVNSLGVAVSQPHTFASVAVFPIIRQGDEAGSYYDYTAARRLADLLDHCELTARTTRKAASFLGAKKIQSGTMPVILGPMATASFLGSVCGAADGESVLRGRSFLSGKKGADIAPALLSVTETPLAEAGLNSEAFDAEGCARADRALIQSGRLTGYLHNATTAAQAGEPLTGHAQRSGYLSGVGIGLTNLVCAPGQATEQELIGNVKNGLYIDMGSLSPNMVSGAVSGTVDVGYIIENGAFAAPVSNAMVGGDIFALLKSIQAVSSDGRAMPGNFMPSLLLGGVAVAGS
jgi:PmbA protein